MSKQMNLEDINKLFAFFAPAIICTGVLLFTLFTSVPFKGILFIFFVFIATAIRYVALPFAPSTFEDKCWAGQNAFKLTGNTTYSSFVIAFSLMYFLIPQIIQSYKYETSMVNYFVTFFFIAYFIYDLLVKSQIGCLNLTSTSAGIGRIMADVFGGSILATLLVCLLYYSSVANSTLFINELNSNKEVCSQPSKQQFKCSVYKNGELVKQTIK